MRRVVFLASLLVGCGPALPVPVDASFEDRPFEPCGTTHEVIFEATVPVGAIMIELWIETGTRNLDDCFVRNPDALLYSMSCSANLDEGEPLGFRVLVDEAPLCRLDPLDERPIGTVRIVCGSEELAFERIPHPVDGCTYIVL